MMQVAISGSSPEAGEFYRQLIEQGVNAQLIADKDLPEIGGLLFDFDHASKERMKLLKRSRVETLFINIPCTTLAEVLNHERYEFEVFGFNGLPGFSRLNSLEISHRPGQVLSSLKRVSEAIKLDLNEITDTIGMVSPRVVCMIINEAYFTFQDGTAKPSDIDLSMRLGTNYPLGPFEWAKKIGLPEVVKLLDRVFDYTHDERYKVCTALRMEAAGFTQP